MNLPRAVLATTIATSLAVGAAWAQTRPAADQPVHQAYGAVMARMQQDMPHGQSADPDHLFAQMMMPHHQAAVDMAKIQLQHGKDPELKRMAQKMVDDQQKEIAALRTWLQQHPSASSGSSR